MVCYDRLSCLVEKCVSTSFGNGVKFELGGVPCNSDLCAFLNIEMAIGLVQWSSFATMPSRTSNPLSVVIVGSMSGGFAIP